MRVAWSIPVIAAAVIALASALAVPVFEGILAVMAVAAVAVLLVPAAAYRAYRAPGGRGPAALKVLAMTVVTAPMVLVTAMTVGSPLRRWAFERAAARARPVIEAIQRFDDVNGRPPEALGELVPVHLPGVPATGLLSYPTFEYEKFADTPQRLVWWDLGSRAGAPMAGLLVYPDGDPEHAILALELDGGNAIMSARVDRMPAAADQKSFQRPFDADTWRSNPDSRLHMVRDLPNAKGDLRGQSRSTVEGWLGVPDGTRTLRDARWELRIPCPSGGINWDVFFYWPGERYPEHIYGGSVERIGQWAYVHE